MKKHFNFQEVVTYQHTIVVDIPDDKEEEYEDFEEQAAQEFYGTDDRYNLISAFNEEYGSDNVAFIEDGSPEVEITCD